MGYMGLEHLGESDTAVGAALDAVQTMVKSLKKSLREKGNDYNTGGPENVAMFLIEFVIPAAKAYASIYHEELDELIELTTSKLAILIERVKKTKDEWDDMKNYQYHLNKYKEWHKKLSKLPDLFEKNL